VVCERGGDDVEVDDGDGDARQVSCLIVWEGLAV